MASSSEGKAPAEVKEEGQAAVLAKVEKEEEKKTKKVRRFTQQQINGWIAAGEPTLPIENKSPLLMENLSEEFLAKFPQHVRDAFAKLDADREEEKASMLALQERLRKERQDILDQYYTKGYAEYEVDTDDDGEEEEASAARAPRPGRRRFRQGLVKRGGSTKKLN